MNVGRGGWLVLAGLVLAGCSAREEPRGRGGGRAGRPVVVAQRPIVHRALAERLTLTGTLEATQRVAVAALEAGTLVAVPAVLGERVPAGATLAALDDAEARQRLAQAEAALEAARATRDGREAERGLAARQAARERLLAAQELTAQQDLEVVETRLLAAQAQARLAAAEVRRAQAVVGEARERLARMRLVAPMAGVVAARHLDPGARVAPGNPVVTLLGTAGLRLALAAPEGAWARLTPGLPATLRFDALPGVSGQARVARVAPVLEPATRTGLVELALERPPATLRPGLIARASFTLAPAPATLCVPREALVQGPTGLGAYQVQDGRARFVPLTAGLEADGWVAVSGAPAGWRAGTRVVTAGAHLLQDGTVVAQPEASGSGPVAPRRRRGSP